MSIRELASTIFGTIGVLLTTVVIFSVAFIYFEGWWIISALLAQIAVMLAVIYYYRWTRYPGLYQSKTTLRLTTEFLGALFTFSGGLLIIALLGRFHLLKLVPTNRIGEWLGLEFKFKKGEAVRVSSAAAWDLMPGCEGVVTGTRVLAQDETGMMPLKPIGTVYYTVQFFNSTKLEIAENDLVDTQPM